MRRMVYKKDQSIIVDKYSNFSNRSTIKKHKSYIRKNADVIYCNPKKTMEYDEDCMFDKYISERLYEFDKLKVFCEKYEVHQSVHVNNKRDDRAWRYARVGFIDRDKTMLYLSKPFFSHEDINQMFDELYGMVEILSRPFVSYSNDSIDEDTYFVFKPQGAAYIAHEIFGHSMENDYYNLFTRNMLDEYKTKPLLDNIVFKEINYYKSFNLKSMDDSGEEVPKDKLIIKDGKIIDTISSMMINDRDGSVGPRMSGTILYSNSNRHFFPDTYVNIYNVSSGFVDFVNKKVILYVELATYVKDEKELRLPKCCLQMDWAKFFEGFVDVRDDVNIYQNYCVKNGQVIDVFSGAPTVVMRGFQCKYL